MSTPTKVTAIHKGIDPMKIAIASGKGGTGKTLIASSLAQIFASPGTVLLDTDVEEPNTGLFLCHKAEGQTTVYRPVARIDSDRCIHCGICAEICQFNALVVLPSQVLVFDELCHSCSACKKLCPNEAVYEESHPIGTIERASFENDAVLFTGRLNIGETQSVPLIKAVKECGQDADLVLVDCPPGTTCPMIEAIRSSDYCILVTEPSPFGLHDLELSLEACSMVDVPCGILINRDRGDSKAVYELADQYGVAVIGVIPYSESLARTYAKGQSPLTKFPLLKSILEDLMKTCKEALSCKKS